MDLKRYIRNIPDFPKEGVNFKDITPLLQNTEAFNAAIFQMYEKVHGKKIDYVVSMEARGFIFGAPLALKLGAGFIPVRKPGKLPYKVKEAVCIKEYGEDKLCIHEDAIPFGSSILIVDDLLATGGTVEATANLVKELGGKIVGLLFLMELSYLNGKEKLGEYAVDSILIY